MQVSVIKRMGLAWGVVAACAGDGPTPPNTPGIAAVEIVAPELRGLPGWTLQLAATVRDSAGAVVPEAEVEWASGFAPRAVVDTTGLVTFGAQRGYVLIIAREVTSGLADTVTLRVAGPGEMRWRVRLPRPLQTGTGPTLDGRGGVWVLTWGFDPGTTTSRDGDVYRLSERGEIICSAHLAGVHENYGIAWPEREGIWIVGLRSWHLADDCTVLDSADVEAPDPLLLSGAVSPSYLYAMTAFHLIAFTPDFTELWRSRRDPTGGWLQPPTVAGGRVYAKVSMDSLHVFDGLTGEVLWSGSDPDSTPGPKFGAGPVVTPERVYLPSRRALSAYDLTGARLWGTDPWGVGGSDPTEPVVTPDGRLVLQDQFGLVMRGSDGAELWRRPEAGVTFGWSGGPALAEGGIVYAATRDGFHAYDLDGNLRWNVRTEPGDSAWFAGAPAIGPDHTIYTWSGTTVYAIFGDGPPEPASPWPMWRRDAQRTGWVR